MRARKQEPLMIRSAFMTVTDQVFFPGTVATVNSILRFHPEATIYVVVNHNLPLTAPQVKCLRASDQVRLVDSRELERPGRHINAWELKAYAASDLLSSNDVLIGIDSDCLLCSSIEDEILECHASGGLAGGADGDGTHYDASYAPYGMPTPSRNPKYMSTSLFFVANTPENQAVLERWASCCSSAVFNNTGPHPGHGDQGVLNAVMFALKATDRITLLENRLWSQHWVYWDSIIDFRDGAFVNISAGGKGQRSFHCGGAEKFWAKEHRDRVVSSHALQTYPYVWFLTMFWFGPCRDWSVDPCQYLPGPSHHLLQDVIEFLPQIVQLDPGVRSQWNSVSDQMIDRALNGTPRALSLGGGSMSEVIDLIAANPGMRRYVEVGSYEGGSILTLGIRFLNRDIDFFSVESFMGNLNGTMDGHRLPERRRYIENLAGFPTLRVTMTPGDSAHAATLFDDGSVDCVFVDACHDTWAVLRDIDVWLKKIAPGGIIAGDDYGWDSVRQAVGERFPGANITPSGCVWWTRV